MKSNEEAKQWVINGMTSCTPKGCDLPFTDVLSAKFIKEKLVVANVRMFDGHLAVLEVSQSLLGGFPSWGLYWREDPGGAAECVGTKWRRVDTSVQDERVVQGVLF
jgi:hypothetical protein